MAGVRYANANNSTLFTTCCDTAIVDSQSKCPRCGTDVYPFYEGMSQAERDEAGGGYYNHNTSVARHSSARGKGYGGF